MIVARIEGGIEWINDSDRDQEFAQCARCGSSAEFAYCTECGGDGFLDTDADDDEFPNPVECEHCAGTGGAAHCLSTPEYCQANPIAGREQIESTAMSPEAWSDVL